MEKLVTEISTAFPYYFYILIGLLMVAALCKSLQSSSILKDGKNSSGYALLVSVIFITPFLVLVISFFSYLINTHAS